jgi:hypothetical protein
MAIQRIGGNMLESNLTRVSDLAFQTNLLYLDISNDRVGIKTNAPGNYALDVNGTARIQSDLTVGGNATITGDLTVEGTTTTINTTNTTVEDPILLLNSAASTGNDSGIMINRTGNNAAFYWDEDDTKFKLVTTTSTASNTQIIDSAFADFQVNDITANDVTVNSLATDGISITDNVISTTRSNDNLILSPAGTGTISASGKKIQNVDDPAADQDAATKAYVDSQVSSIPTLGDFTFTNNRITQTASNADFELDNSGTGNFLFVGTSGIVVPRGDTASRPSPQPGIIRYNTTTSKYEVSQDGSTWTALRTEQTAREIIKDVWEGDGSTTTFYLTTTPADADNVIVYIDGVMQEPVYNYTITGNVLAFDGTAPGDSTTEAPHIGARVVIIQGLAEAID